MNFLTIIKTLFQLLPLVIEAVKTIEAAFPAQGAGAAKLAIVKSTLESAYTTATDVQGSFETLWTPLQSMISGIVSIANSTGLFKKN